MRRFRSEGVRVRPAATRAFAGLCIVAVLAGTGLVPTRADAAPSIRIIGGGVVASSTVPWTVALLHSAQSNVYQAQFCGGSLIDQQWVLTAAHCVVGTGAASVDVGWGHTNLSDFTVANRHAVTQIVVHPAYNAAKNTSDVALLKLATAVPGAPIIDLNPIESWPALNDGLDTYGWGNISTTTSSYPDDLHGVHLVDMSGPTGACGNYGAQYIALHMLCAGVPGGGKDACQGDSGGPIVMPMPGNPTVPLLVGVTSWGNGCAQNGYPGLWSRVSTYVPWINKTLFSTKPTVAIGSTSVVEGDTGTRVARFTVTLSRKATTSVSIPFHTIDGTAQSGSDYVAKNGTTTFPAGAVSKVISITVKPDAFVEGDETFSVALGTSSIVDPLNPPFSATGAGTIINDDPNGVVPALSIGDVAVFEGDAGKSQAVQLTVSLSSAATSSVVVNWQTVSGSASAGSDFMAKAGSLTFAPGARSKVVNLTVIPDYLPEGYADEEFIAVLSTSSLAVTVTRPVGTVTLVGDDA